MKDGTWVKTCGAVRIESRAGSADISSESFSDTVDSVFPMVVAVDKDHDNESAVKIVRYRSGEVIREQEGVLVECKDGCTSVLSMKDKQGYYLAYGESAVVVREKNGLKIKRVVSRHVDEVEGGKVIASFIVSGSMKWLRGEGFDLRFGGQYHDVCELTSVKEGYVIERIDGVDVVIRKDKK